MTVTKPRTKDKKKRVLTALLLLALCFTLLPLGSNYVTVTADEPAAPLPLRSHRIVQYIHDSRSFPLTDAHAHLIDQLNYAFALIEDGQADVSHLQGLQQAQKYLTRHPHITGVLSIGGWGADGFSQACATPAGRQLLANSILSVMDEYGFTGVDIDWEYPGTNAGGIASSENDIENWYDLLFLLRAGLDERETSTGREYILSVALSASDEQITAIDGGRLNDLIDQAVIMAYDLRGFDRMTGHHAGLYPDGETMLSGAWAVQSWINNGLSSDRMLLGIPQYGRMWRQVTASENPLHARAETSGNKIIPLTEIPALMEDGYERYYDENAQAPYLFNGTNFISYDDAASTREKLAYVQEHNLAGVALWEGSQDADSIILNALNNVENAQEAAN